jgi:DNA invertase Pin-like site-specific DNA recombinase
MDRDFNSLESQREVCSAYIRSQRHKGWVEVADRYDDGGQSGGTLERPALQKLISDIERGAVDMVVIYKIDRLTRSIRDFVRLMDQFERYETGFVSITQNFDTSDSMGRLILNILLTFAQFEREMAADRIRDKVALMKRRGQWTGGPPPFGYDVSDGKLVVNADEATQVRQIFARFLELGSYVALKQELQAQGMRTKVWVNRKGVRTGGGIVSSGMVYGMLASRWYVGDVPHYHEVFAGEHEAIVDRDVWERAQELRARRAMYKLVSGPSPNILLGLLHDGEGRRMTIADDQTRGRRYRYYISDQARWATRRGIKRLRVEADTLEALIVAAIATALRDGSATRNALVALGQYTAETERLVAAAPAAAGRLERALPERRSLILKVLLARIEVSPTAVSIIARSSGLECLLTWNGRGILRPPTELRHRDEIVYVIDAPAATVRVNRSLVLPLRARDPASIETPRASLVSLLREAREAKAQIDEDRSTPIAEIAARFRRQPGTFARIIRLTYLAPDIVAAIMDGRQPESLTRRALLYANLPMDWAQQRTLFGFPPHAELQTSDERY